MINPHIKNQRTGFHEDIFNRSSHYLKIINSKSKIDNNWAKGSLKVPYRNTFQRSQELTRAEDNLRLMRKIIDIERRPVRYQTQQKQSTIKKSLKNEYKEYRKELAISQQNMKILKKISNIKSELSKKKMESFVGDITKYGQFMQSPKDKVSFIDNLFYSNYKLEVMKDRTQTVTDKMRAKINRKKFKSVSGNKTKEFLSEKKFSPGLVLE